MSSKVTCSSLALLVFLLVGCTFSVSATDPLHLTMEVMPFFKTNTQTDNQPASIPVVGTPLNGQATGQAPRQAQRYIALHTLSSTSALSATAVLTTQQWLITSNVVTPLQGIGLFSPPGSIRLAVAHPFTESESVTETLLTDTDWVLFLPDHMNANVQSWEQILITPSAHSDLQSSLNLDEIHYSLRHTVREVIPFARQATPAADLSAIDEGMSEWSSSHGGHALWVDLIITEEKRADGRTDLVLYRFVNRDGNPSPEDEKKYYCTVQLACSSADSVGETVVCWWNGCS